MKNSKFDLPDETIDNFINGKLSKQEYLAVAILAEENEELKKEIDFRRLLKTMPNYHQMLESRSKGKSKKTPLDSKERDGDTENEK